MNEEIIQSITAGIVLIILTIALLIGLIIYWKELAKTEKEEKKLKNELYKKALTLMTGIEKTTIYKDGLWYEMFYGKDKKQK